MQRDTTVDRGCKLGGVAGALYAISQREYNHEAATRPSDGSTVYNVTESVSLIRQGYLYVQLTGAAAVAIGDALSIDSVDGEFTMDLVGVNADAVILTNVFSEEAGIAVLFSNHQPIEFFEYRHPWHRDDFCTKRGSMQVCAVRISLFFKFREWFDCLMQCIEIE